MSRNVHLAGYLTIALYLLVAGCRNEGTTTEQKDPEAEYFKDYESPAGKWGFLDTTGQIVIPAKYDQVSGFAEGLAPASLSGRWGYIDHHDSVAIPFEYRADDLAEYLWREVPYDKAWINGKTLRFYADLRCGANLGNQAGCHGRDVSCGL